MGTPYYMSPELFEGKAYNHKSGDQHLQQLFDSCSSLESAVMALVTPNRRLCKTLRGQRERARYSGGIPLQWKKFFAHSKFTVPFWQKDDTFRFERTGASVFVTI